jgi:hypothetical protein
MSFVSGLIDVRRMKPSGFKASSLCTPEIGSMVSNLIVSLALD